MIHMLVVPNDAPNDDGKWVRRRVPAWVISRHTAGPNRFDNLTLRAPKGTHAVRYHRTYRKYHSYKGYKL